MRWSCLGVNDHELSADHTIVSNASCTTNCFAPMVKVLDDAFGVDQGMITTIHAYTGTQNLIDGPHKDLRRARAALINLIPTSTGAAKATGLVLASSAGQTRRHGRAGTSCLRDQPPTSSACSRPRHRSTRSTKPSVWPRLDQWQGILAYSEDPLVSSDIVGRPESCVYDSGMTMAMGEDGQDHRLVRQRVGLLEPHG